MKPHLRHFCVMQACYVMHIYIYIYRMHDIGCILVHFMLCTQTCELVIEWITYVVLSCFHLQQCRLADWLIKAWLTGLGQRKGM